MFLCVIVKQQHIDLKVLTVVGMTCNKINKKVSFSVKLSENIIKSLNIKCKQGCIIRKQELDMYKKNNNSHQI